MFDESTTVEGRRRRVSGGSVSVDLSAADHVDHARALRDVDLLRRQVDAAQIDVVVSAIEQGVHLEDGHRSTASWICAVLDVPRRTSFEWGRRAALAERFPEYLEALRDGRLTLDHFDVIARAYSNPRARGVLGDFVDEFVAAAGSLPFADFERMVGVWERLADESGGEPDSRVPLRGLNFRNRRDGSCALNGFFQPEAAAALTEIVNRFLDEENSIDREAAAADEAAGGSGEMARTLGERRADALMAALCQSVTRQPGEAARPLTQLVLSWRVAQQLLQGFDPTAPADARDLLCRTLDGDVVDPEAALAALIEGRVQVMVVDAMGNPFTLGRPQSLFNERERRALQALHPQCEYPGCPVHARHLQADHVVARSRGGPTSMDNAAALCGRHNRWRFTHDYHLVRDPDGRIRALRPDGTAV